MIDNNNNNNIITTSTKYDNRERYYHHYGDSYSQERKIDLITEGLEPLYAKALGNISKENALAIVDFLLNINIEINLSDNHKRNYINILPNYQSFIIIINHSKR